MSLLTFRTESRASEASVLFQLDLNSNITVVYRTVSKRKCSIFRVAIFVFPPGGLSVCVSLLQLCHCFSSCPLRGTVVRCKTAEPSLYITVYSDRCTHLVLLIVLQQYFKHKLLNYTALCYTVCVY